MFRNPLSLLGFLTTVLVYDGHSIHAFSSPSGHKLSSSILPIASGRPSTARYFLWESNERKTIRDQHEEVGKANALVNTAGMPELVFDKEDEEMKPLALALDEQNLMAPISSDDSNLLVLLGLAAAALLAAKSIGLSLSAVQAFQADPTGTLQSLLPGESGASAIIYFGCLYVIAELIAIPATPLTLSAGYLFGLAQGTAVVLAAGTVSAMIGFFIGRTFLRDRVEGVLDDKPAFRKLDRAVGAEGLKLLVLVRLAPVFPFSLLNYFYGASSISFPAFCGGTLLGFVPTTAIYVYTGLAGKELMLGGGGQPWYVYVGSVAVLFGLLKLVTDVATNLIEAVDEIEES